MLAKVDYCRKSTYHFQEVNLVGMAIFYGLLIVIGCGIYIYFKTVGKPKPFNPPRQHPTSQHPTSQNIRTRPADFSSDDQGDDDDEGGNWFSKRHKVGTFQRPSGMVPPQGMSALSLKGTAYRVKEGFIETMRADRPTVSFRIERETTNVHDRKATRIWGTGSRGSAFNLGYVPAESAKLIADTYSEVMPNDAELVSSGYTAAEDAAYVKVRLPGPNAADRKKFLKKQEPRQTPTSLPWIKRKQLLCHGP